MSYPAWLLGISALFAVLEKLAPARKDQPALRPGAGRDLAFLAINGHLFSLLTTGLAGALAVGTTTLLQNAGFRLADSPIRHWPFFAQFVTFLILSDFLQWCIHNLLHRVPWLWTFHKVHHSISTMDWLGNWHFHWMEIVIYKGLQWLPLAWLDASPVAVFAVAVVSTFWGEFNHANLNVSLGPLGYLLNTPRMHLWHHDQSDEGGPAKNFGVIFSLWDFLFGTAHWPRDRDPSQLGYPGMTEMPQSLVGQLSWPLTRQGSREGQGAARLPE